MRFVQLAVTIFALIKLFAFIWSFYDQVELKRKRKKKTGKSSGKLRFAAVIPAHNEEASIGKTVRSILEAGLRPEDIYVLCNGCRDNTAGEVEKCGVTPHIAPVRGKETTINWAIHVANLFPDGKYDYLCFFDADTVAKSDYFKVIRERLELDPVDGICGQPKSLPCNWLTAHRAVQYWEFHWLHKAAQSKLNCILVVPGCAGAYSMQTMREIRWSDDTRIGDMSMTIECYLKGKRIVFEEKAIVYTQDPNNMRDYTQQLYKRWNRGLWMNMRKYGVLWSGWFSILHWDCRMIFLEQFMIPVLPFILWATIGPYPLWKGMLLFASLIWAESVYFAFRENRWDVLKYMAIFPVLKVYDLMMFIGSAPSIMDLKERDAAWTSPQRYK